MADIIVRIPKKQLAHFRDDKLRAPEAFWRFSSKPRRLREGEDYIWFTRPEGVIAGAQVKGVLSTVEDTDDRTGRWNVLWDGLDLTLLDPPVKKIQYAGRGFRYLKPEEQRRLRSTVAGE